MFSRYLGLEGDDPDCLEKFEEVIYLVAKEVYPGGRIPVLCKAARGRHSQGVERLSAMENQTDRH